MIDKNFYLENLSAFDILIEDEREKAEEVIFRVYCILQRDKIWLQEVATEEEIIEEDAELLEEVEAELLQLDEEYEFRFDDFYQRIQQEIKKKQSNSTNNLEGNHIIENESKDESDNLTDDEMEEEEEESDDDFSTDDYDEMYDDEEDDYSDNDALSHLSEEELDEVTDFILASAKKRFDFQDFLQDFPEAEESFVDEEFLLPVIAGKAFGETDTEIAGVMLISLLEFGYQIDVLDLTKMIAQKGKELGPEILAFKIASDSLNQGAYPAAVIQQISQLLKI
ncbi:hypothetical protein [Chryseobacterium sp. MP_3.2]|uniref:hypothetical protein n=1 Tax=Chryseobacterium sp. MP_3.2 TaxID=3071712 RepID=UPI002DFA2DB9|nr:hypothetical protein [Chryseobacterium sp. MP_3.2]